MYKCYVCGRQFSDVKRTEKDALWNDYSEGKQTYIQLGERYGRSTRTVQR